jgi:KaiC/GvpD/RAD55 family RecA-like ATPase
MPDVIKYVDGMREFGLSVFPLRPGDKRPDMDWAKFQKEHYDGDYDDDSNVGVVTGAISNLLVVDADSDEAIEWVEKNLPHTPVKVKTPRGKHYWYAYDNCGIRNLVSLAPGVDVRGEGGYVVTPPSTVNGKRYRWEVSPGAKLCDLPPPPDLLKQAPEKKGAIPFAGTPAGGRNNTLARWAGVLYGSTCYQDEEIYSMLQDLNHSFKPPLPDEEVRRVMSSISSREKHKKVALEYSAINAMSTWEDYTQSLKETSRVKTGISLLDGGIGNGLYSGEILNIVGGPGAMKTSLALNILEWTLVNTSKTILFLSLDMPREEIVSRLMLRSWNSPEPLLDAAARRSEDYMEAKRKFEAKTLGRLFLVGNDLMTLPQIDSVIKEVKPQLLFLDYVTCVDGFRDELACSREVMKWVRRVGKRDRCTCVLLHQMSKQSLLNQASGILGNNSMGGSSAQQVAWFEIELVKDFSDGGERPIIATITKARRGGKDGESYLLHRDGERMKFSGTAEKVSRERGGKPLFSLQGINL